MYRVKSPSRNSVMASWMQPDHEREQDGGLDFLVDPVDDGDGAQHGNGDRVGWAVDQLLRRVEDRADGGHYDRSVEAILRRDTGNHRVCHRLGHSNGGNRQSGDRIRACVREPVVAERIEGGNEAQESRRERGPRRQGAHSCSALGAATPARRPVCTSQMGSCMAANCNLIAAFRQRPCTVAVELRSDTRYSPPLAGAARGSDASAAPRFRDGAPRSTPSPAVPCPGRRGKQHRSADRDG